MKNYTRSDVKSYKYIRSFPIIRGKGAEQFYKNLEEKYSERIKEFYKNSKDLVRKLGIFD